MKYIAFAICPMLAALSACTTPAPVQTVKVPATKEVVRIGQMRPADDSYWAFCQPNCQPPTPKARAGVVQRPPVIQAPDHTDAPPPGVATQIR